MKIGVDIDGVLTNLSDFEYKYGKKYFKKSDDEIDRSTLSVRKMFNVSKKEESKFWLKYIWKYCLSEKLRPDMVDALNKLHDASNEIHIITARVHTTEDTTLGSFFRWMVRRSLNKAGLKYEGINYVSDENSAEEKKKICENLGIDVMIEDEVDNINSIKDTSYVYVVDHEYNKEVKDDKNVKRISGGNSLLNQMKKYNSLLKDGVYMGRDPYKIRYGITRTIGKPYFMKKFKPIIIGKENIPKNGPIILAGNHLHVLDQFPVICATKRVTHWMAKKEYFEGKQRAFFKQTGAICVDRQGNAKEAEIEAINYLNNGSAVGIFPEGTRNITKQDKYPILLEFFPEASEEEISMFIKSKKYPESQIRKLLSLYDEGRISKSQLRYTILNGEIGDCLLYLRNCSYISEEEYIDSFLLPFKMGAINMAKKTGALIIPFAVTGSYNKKDESLIVSFAPPMDVTDLSYEDANKELRNKVLSLELKNKR